jgi:hypothetical protein
VSTDGSTAPHLNSGETCVRFWDDHWGWCWYSDPGVSPDVEVHVVACHPLP